MPVPRPFTVPWAPPVPPAALRHVRGREPVRGYDQAATKYPTP